jgi:hypothetical protein
MLTEKDIEKGGNQGIIVEFYNFIQNVNIDGFM